MGHVIGCYGVNMERHRRSFAGRHPLFVKRFSDTGIWWEESPYYLWWEYLRRHEGYRRACARGGGGSTYRRLYEDFGDVHSLSFKEWWTQDGRGARLFAEPPAPVRVMALSDEEAIELIEAGRDERTLLVAIPLDYRHRTITKALRQIVKAHQGRKRGEKRVRRSRALYPLAHAPDASALKTTLQCYDLRMADPSMPLWQIAQTVGVSTRLTQSELAGKGGHVADKKASMTAGVSRKLKHAHALIEAVGKGIFPAP